MYLTNPLVPLCSQFQFFSYLCHLTKESLQVICKDLVSEMARN